MYEQDLALDILQYLTTKSEGPAEYTNCTSTEEKPPQRVSWNDIKQSDGEVPINLELWIMWSTPFFSIAFRFTLGKGGSTKYGPIYGSNRTVWHLNCVQRNIFC